MILISPQYIYKYYYPNNQIDVEMDFNISEFENEYKDLKYKIEDSNLYIYLEI